MYVFSLQRFCSLWKIELYKQSSLLNVLEIEDYDNHICATGVSRLETISLGDKFDENMISPRNHRESLRIDTFRNFHAALQKDL
ncbi:hypothetical protein TNCV_592731 [Trichonephila clavipes]|nr:hypothetical protein TNCV_592731 [Trichonephila clavipes]